MQGKTLIPPKEPSLPSFTVSYNYPFENIGIDHAGSIYYKGKSHWRHRMQKCYFLLIKCRIARAIHLEVTCNVDATSLVLAWRQFISRNGIATLYLVITLNRLKRQFWKNCVEITLLPGSSF